MIDIARNTALNVLIEYDKSGVFPNLALKKHLRDIKSTKDKNFICALVYGVIEKRFLLDYYISKFSSVKIKKINIVVLNVLRLGLYQIMFLSTPSSAACNTSVDLAKKNGQYKSSGFVNAILRKLSQNYLDIEIPEDLSVKYSINPNILKVLTASLGAEDTEKFLQHVYDNKSMYISVNSIKISSDELVDLFLKKGISVEKTDYSGLLKISSSLDIERSEEYKNGLFHVISLPSYIAAMLIKPSKNDKILDMCSAPGGKLFTMAYMCNDSADIKAFDMHEHKIENLIDNCKRLSVKNVYPSLKNCCEIDKTLYNYADKILCDVPCSGLGMIFKKPDIKYNSIDFEDLIETQYTILSNSSKYLKSGGRLIYSTCTVNADENFGVINRFLKDNPSFVIDKDTEIFNGNYGQYTFLPHIDNTDGFYIAILKRQ